MLTKMTEEDWVIVRDQQDSRSFFSTGTICLTRADGGQEQLR